MRLTATTKRLLKHSALGDGELFAQKNTAAQVTILSTSPAKLVSLRRGGKLDANQRSFGDAHLADDALGCGIDVG